MLFKFTYLKKVIFYILQRVALIFRETFFILHKKEFIMEKYMSNITPHILG